MREKEFLIILVIQCVFLTGLWTAGQSVGGLLAAGVISLLCLTQGILSAQSRPDSRHNILYSGFLLQRHSPVILILLCLAVAPFLYCMMSGEELHRLHDISAAHNNLISIIGNSIGWVIEICVLALLSRSESLRNFIQKGFPYQDVARTIFLDISLICTLTFVAETSAGKLIDEHTRVHNTFNSVYITILFYLLLSSAYCVAAYIFQHGKMRGGMFREKDILLLEPCVAVFFILGLISRPDENTFIHFTVFCPITIFLIATLIGFYKVDTTMGVGSGTVKTAPISFQTSFMLLNFIAYAAVMAIQYQKIFLIVPLAAIGIWFLMSVFVGSLRAWMQYRQRAKAIWTLNTLERDETYFDDKVRIYHQLRKSK
ncbi:MAG: hypothetical protein LBN12_04810 [Clostridiales Family XIII bacterium]|nr:hypothetical protein [Clostridiales Family XIII bacterium]